MADTLRGLLDGHLLLSRELAHRGHFPAIDLLASLSRLMPAVTDARQLALAQELRSLLATWRDSRDLVEIGAYKPGANRALDRVLRILPEVDAFLRQKTSETTPLAETLARLKALLERGS